jgi:hypothetical protein
MSHNNKRGRESFKRAPPEASSEQKLHSKIFEAQADFGFARLADLARSLEDECRNKQDNAVCKVLLDCAEFLPFKTRLYAVLIGLINLRMPSFGALVAEQACARLSQSLVSGFWGFAAARLRTLCELCSAHVIPFKVIAVVLRQLLPATGVLRPAVAVVLTALPWVGRSLALREAQALESALKVMGDYVRSSSSRFPRILCVWDDDEVADNQISWMWDQVSAMRRNYWEGCQETIPSMSGSFETALEKAQSHMPPTLVNLSFVLRSEEGFVPVEHCKLFRLFDKTVSEKDCTGADRLVIESYIVELMRQFSESPDFVASRLVLLPMRFPVEHIVVETILGQLLMLPSCELRPVFYYAVLNQMCRGTGGPRIAPVVMQAFDLLYQKVDHMDPEARDRTVECMSFHLSNFGFRFEWRKWDEVLSLPEDDARVLFVRAVLARCVRLGYWSRVERELPSASWVALLPPAPRPDPSVVVDPDVLAALMSGVMPKPELMTLELLLPAVLSRGETHSLLKLALRQYGGALRSLASSDEAKVQALRIVGRLGP